MFFMWDDFDFNVTNNNFNIKPVTICYIVAIFIDKILLQYCYFKMTLLLQVKTGN